MPTLSTDDLTYIAHLARLQFAEKDLRQYSKDLSNILQLAAEMNAAETDNIQPMAHPLELTQRLREDEITETDQRELFQSIAPLVENGLYLVPKVIEEE